MAPDPTASIASGSLLVLVPLAGMTVNVALQLLLARMPLAVGPVRRQFFCFGCGLLLTLAALAIELPRARMDARDRLGLATMYVLSYAFLGFIFFNVINLNVSSLRIRMLKEYLARDPAPLSDSELMRKYPAGDRLDARLDRLEAGGQIVRRNGRIYIRRRSVALIAHVFAGLRALLLPS
jgi:hypothetical protein